MILVDPPSGWKYGFPKEFDFEPSHPNLPGEEYEIEFKEWFVDNGYPQKLISDGMLKHCRYIAPSMKELEELNIQNDTF